MKLSSTQRELLRMAADRRGCHPGHADLNVCGMGSGVHAAARALGRKKYLRCWHPGGPAWGEWNITQDGRDALAAAAKAGGTR